MADYEVKAPPNLRSVDCCATCWHVKAQGYADVACGRFLKKAREPHVAGYFTLVPPTSICDAFEREVRNGAS